MLAWPVHESPLTRQGKKAARRRPCKETEGLLLLFLLQCGEDVIVQQSLVGLAGALRNGRTSERAVVYGAEVQVARLAKRTGLGLHKLLCVRHAEFVHHFGRVGFRLVGLHLTHGAYVKAQLAEGTALVVLNPEDSLEFLIGVFLILVNIREDVEFRQLSPVRIVNQVEQAQRRVVGVDGGSFFFCDEGGRETRQEKRDQYGRPKAVG